MDKMLLRGFWLVGLAGLVLPAFGQISGPLDPQRDFVATDKNAYLMLPPSVICGPTIKESLWSRDGERLLILRSFTELTPEQIADFILAPQPRQTAPPPAEQQLISWNSITRKQVVMYKISDRDGHIDQMEWMTGSSSAVIIATFNQPDGSAPERSEVLLVNANGAIKHVAPFEFRMNCMVESSPYRPIAAYVEYPDAIPGKDGQPASQEAGSVRFFSFDGVLGQPVKFPAPHSYLQWSSDGRAYCLTIERSAKTKTVKKLWSVANTSTHKFDSCSEPPDSGFNAPEIKEEIGVVRLSAKASFNKVGINAPTIVASATDETKDNQPGVVTTDGINPDLSPKLNAISYVGQGSLMVRSLVKVPLDAYRRALDAALRTQLLSKAKQVGLGLIMYSGDYDDVLPSNKGNWASLLEPYLKDTSLTDGFNYTFAGGNAANIENPAETQLGYFEGPGGRAVVYSDGHARWIPNP